MRPIVNMLPEVKIYAQNKQLGCQSRCHAARPAAATGLPLHHLRPAFSALFILFTQNIFSFNTSTLRASASPTPQEGAAAASAGQA